MSSCEPLRAELVLLRHQRNKSEYWDETVVQIEHDLDVLTFRRMQSLAKELMARNVAPDSLLCAYRGDMLCLLPKTLTEWSKYRSI